MRKSVLALPWTLSLASALPSGSKSKPNFIFIITDDQDKLLDSVDYQPALKKHFADQGTSFENHFATVALCCPSRVSLLTGRAAHNTNVTDVSPPYGGYTKFISEGWNDKYLPVWLQEEGYNTYYTGKLMNGHSTSTYSSPFAAGWTQNDFFLDPNTYEYVNVTMQRNQEAPRTLTGEYSTDLVNERTMEYMDDALSQDAPFFIGVAPIGPHADATGGGFSAPIPADRHKDMYPDLKVPRTANFNPDLPSGGGWMSQLPKQNQTVLDYNDNWYRQRILALQSVDETLDAIMERLEAHPDVLENTYLIYTADNGYHIGQHRLAPGKTCAIEEDYNVPFYVRGPGVAKGQTSSFPTSHTDIVPTIFELAGIPLQAEFDGEPIPVTGTQASAARPKSEQVNLEFWGAGIQEGIYQPGESSSNTYKGLRVIGEGYDISYTVWCTNEHNLYDMKADKVQMTDLYNSEGQINGWNITTLIPRVDSLMLTLKGCKGAVCTRPWETLHPQGDVASLADAMDVKFDGFYGDRQERVSFSACMDGYLAEFEGVQDPVAFMVSMLD
ncbi:arylsulfatase precursor [Xylariomycetidae sp. FL0641]|nr:arylsulfatase precursor [Xylariomycetidae sp. FL0641]